MGRNRGHQWGKTMAAYGEVSMATVSRTVVTITDPIGASYTRG
jgi:hypothetical protein